MAEPKGNLDFLQSSLDAATRQVTTGAELEATAQSQIVNTREMAVSSDKILDASSTLVDHNKDLVTNTSAFASIAAEMDSAVREGQKATQTMSAVNLDTAKITNSLNAPVRENYTQEVSDPSINEEEDYQRNQIAVYQKRLRELRNDTSFTGQLKRLTLEGATQRRLDQAQRGYAAVQQQKQSAIATFGSSLKANNMFSMSTTAVERAEVTDSLVRAESAIRILGSKQTLNLADEKKLQATLMLDDSRLAHFKTEYKLLQDRGAATNSIIGSLQSKIYAQQIQEQASNRAKTKEQQVDMRAQWETFVKDNGQEEILKTFPDPFSKEFTNNGLATTFLAQLGKQGTKNEFAKSVLTKLHATDVPLSTEREFTASRIMSNEVAEQTQLLATRMEQQIANNRDKDPKTFRDEYEAAMKDVMSLDGQATTYETGLRKITANPAVGIYNGSIAVPDMNAIFTDPANPYSSDMSDAGKVILNSDEFKGINLGFKSKTDVAAQLDGTLNNVVSYLLGQSDKDIRGKIQFTADTSKLVTTTSQMLADYYKVARKMTNQADNGIGSDILPQLAILDARGKQFVLENAAQMEQAIRMKLQSARGDTNFKSLLPDAPASPATPTPNVPALHLPRT